MAKRIQLHAEQWRAYVDPNQPPASLAQHLLAVPLLALAALLVLDGLFSMNFASLAIGGIGLLAARGLHRHSRRFER